MVSNIREISEKTYHSCLQRILKEELIINHILRDCNITCKIMSTIFSMARNLLRFIGLDDAQEQILRSYFPTSDD